MKTIIHVNQHKIKSNAKNQNNEPVITCKTYKSNTYGNQVEILDDSGKVIAQIIYSPNKPLSCGAKVWIQTENKVNVITSQVDINQLQSNENTSQICDTH